MTIATTTSVIAIDGPSGSGKGILCKALANYFNWHVLDSGIIYRLLALSALNHHVNITCQKKLVFLAAHLNILFISSESKLLIVLDGKEVSDKIRTETIANIASKIAILPKVRQALLNYQRTFYKKPGLVADGRDMGTVVFPNALIKIFLHASLEKRAQRRRLQLQKKGFDVNLKVILADMQARDYRDYQRFISPLLPSSDALVLDSTTLSIEEVINQAIWYSKKVLS
ncbi:Cytidylate kinase [Candidatus Ecksteinia adelgidicola]|nr:Cytidylate kinase [Candidatus Ecksteinia adelgidicola]